MLELTLPWPPSDNEHYSHNRRGQTFLSKETKNFRASVAMRFVLSRQKPMSGPMQMTLRCFPPDLKRLRDIGNCLKETGDALQRAKAIDNDYNFWRHVIERWPVFPGGKIVVVIDEYKPLTAMEVG